MSSRLRLKNHLLQINFRYVRQDYYLAIVPSVNLRMLSFVRRNLKTTIVLTLGLIFFAGLSMTDEKGGAPFFGVLFALLIAYVVLSWVIGQWRNIRMLKSEKSKAELMLLKSQINPHFFFNTLNNLYGLTVEKSDQAPEVVLKISEMMRYTIYEGQKEKVPLEHELEYLQNFIELHKMRYHKKVDIQFYHQIIGDQFMITPLLFIILLENAFKHGVENLTTDAYVHISLIAGNNRVTFAIENNFDEAELSESTGIGLQNLERRLELLYPGRHHLSLIKEEDVFKAQLEILL